MKPRTAGWLIVVVLLVLAAAIHFAPQDEASDVAPDARQDLDSDSPAVPLALYPVATPIGIMFVLYLQSVAVYACAALTAGIAEKDVPLDILEPDAVEDAQAAIEDATDEVPVVTDDGTPAVGGDQGGGTDGR